MKKAIIIGAGPSGLTLAYELLKSKKYLVKIIEKDSRVGGLAKSYEFNGNRVDIGGHRYFTKNKQVQKLWDDILPIGEEGMLLKPRSSHILYNGCSFAYPLEISKQLIQSIGIRNGLIALGDYIYSINHKIEEKSLEDFFINRFGKKLYTLFFKDYTEKLWGIPASLLLPDWGSQRIQRLNLSSVIKNIILKNENCEKSLTQYFNYPAMGSGQLWDNLYRMCIHEGAHIVLNSEAIELKCNDERINQVKYIDNKEIKHESADVVISTMPLKDLVNRINNCPEEVLIIANNLKYRDMVTVSFFIECKYAGIQLIENKKDCWIYIQEKTVKAGRLQILNNWSREALNNKKGFLLQVEYYCNENDELWNLADNEIIEFAIMEMKMCQVVSNDVVVEEYLINRANKAYPIYDKTYQYINKVRNWIDGIEGLYCIGRNGRHIYGNIDQVMESAFYAFNVIMANGESKEKIWLVNQDDEYIEKYSSSEK